METLLLYDADCGFCMRAIGLAARLRLTVRVATIQGADLAELGVDPERALAEMPAVLPDGSVVYGHSAVAAALLTGPWYAQLLGRLIASVPWLPSRVYRWVATHRHQLPGGSAACALDQRP